MKIKKSLALFMTAAMALCANVMPAYAAGESKSATTALTAEVSSGYTVTVPESVKLTSSGSGSGTYTGTIPVNIKGDIASTEAVTVTVGNPTLKNQANESVTGTFTSKPKSKWIRTEMSGAGTTSNYVVSASLTPGSWTGTATFTCTLGAA